MRVRVVRKELTYVHFYEMDKTEADLIVDDDLVVSGGFRVSDGVGGHSLRNLQARRRTLIDF